MKWYGDIGFHEEVEEEPGVWVSKIVTRPFYGDVIKKAWREQFGEKINADLHVSNRISIVADPFLLNNFQKIAYITFTGAKWTVSSVEVDVDHPRLTLELGSLYLEEETDED